MTQNLRPALECRQLSLEWRDQLAKFFAILLATGDDEHFHPHPLTDEEAARRCEYLGKDVYYIMVEGNQVLGYGMLRGWDEGFEIPSLGLVVLPEVRGIGMGRLFMQFLHMVARRRGVKQIRLKVYPDNWRAIRLYQELGYVFQGHDSGQLVGTCTFHE